MQFLSGSWLPAAVSGGSERARASERGRDHTKSSDSNFERHITTNTKLFDSTREGT